MCILHVTSAPFVENSRGAMDDALTEHAPPKEESVPRTAIQAVEQMLFELRALRASVGSVHLAEEVHALSLPSATRLGLYSLELPSHSAGRISPEYIVDMCDAIHASSKRLRDGLDPTLTPNVETITTHVEELARTSAELCYASQRVQGFAACADPNMAPLPDVLWTGALAQTSEPSADHALATRAFDALCEGIIPTASSMHLESFHERVDMPEVHDGVEWTHSLTCGGRNIVLDIGLGLEHADGHYVPRVSLQIAYANTASTPAAGEQHAALAEVVRLPLQQLVYILFGLRADANVMKRFALGDTYTGYAQAATLWRSFKATLMTLACVDGLCVSAQHGERLDAFQVLERVGLAAQQVCDTEAQTLANKHGTHLEPARPLYEQDEMVSLLQEHGHGLVMLHYRTPYLCIAFAPGYSATVRIVSSALAFAPDAEATWTPLDGTQVPADVCEPFTAKSREEGRNRPLALLAHIEPGVRVPLRIARQVYLTLGLARHHPSTAQARRPAEGYVQQCLGAASRYRAAWHDEESRCITALPFLTLSHLYAALEILQEHARWTALLSSAAQDTTDDGTLVTLQLEAAKHDGGESSNTSLLSINILTSRRDMSINARLMYAGKWHVDAVCVQLKQRTRITLDTSTADAIAAALHTHTCLHTLTNALLAWAAQTA